MGEKTRKERYDEHLCGSLSNYWAKLQLLVGIA